MYFLLYYINFATDSRCSSYAKYLIATIAIALYAIRNHYHDSKTTLPSSLGSHASSVLAQQYNIKIYKIFINHGARP